MYKVFIYKKPSFEAGFLSDRRSSVTAGRDLGGFKLEFRNNDYTLDITYAGTEADYGWNYAIGIEWNDK
jgi:hypothetical protein